MSLKDRFFRFFGPKVEARSSEPSWGILGGLGAYGPTVNPRTAENLSTVLACVQAISSGIASLPAYVYRVNANGREEAPTHALARLIADGPNPRQTWPDFIEFLVAQALLRGNALAVIVTDPAGRLVELRAIPWEWVQVQVLPSGRLVYDVTEISSLYGGQGRQRRYLDSEVIHIRDRSDDGLVGRSRLSRAADVVAGAVAVQGIAEGLYRNGINPSGSFSVPGKLDKDARAALRKQLTDTYAGPSNTAKFLILDQGLQWSAMSVTPEDAELLDSRRFTTEEIARIFGCPPPLVGIWDHSSFTNSETAGRWFAQFTLGPWIRKIEAEFNRALLSGGRIRHSLEIDLSGFTRGDYEARWRAHEIAVKNGILLANEVREVEGWNPLPAGEEKKSDPSATMLASE